MLKILVPVDGSDNALRAIDYVIALAARAKDVAIHIVTVRDAMDSPQLHRFWTQEQIHTFQQESGKALLDAARQRLDQAGLPYTSSIAIGDIPETIVREAADQQCTMIVMGTRGMGTIASLMLGSVATKVVHLAKIPVTLIK